MRRTTSAESVFDALRLPALRRAFRLQVRTVRWFHRQARAVAGTACPVAVLPASALRGERNVFSTLFLAVTAQMLGQSRYLPLYAVVNQGMRAWVTACDNLLDDEYREVIPFARAVGDRTRSVLTLLIADRVVAEYITRWHDRDTLVAALRVSLAALVPSALQESEEEARPVPLLTPDRILDDVHVRKTGDLFLAPLALPLNLEPPPPGRAAWARQALKPFGLACQILDDIKDLPEDLRDGRHNLLASLEVRRGRAPEALRRRVRGGRPAWNSWERFPAACAEAWGLALERFAQAFEAWTALGLRLGVDERAGVVSLMARLLGVPVLADLSRHR